MSSSNRARLTRISETTLGVAPTPGAMQRVRRTGGEFQPTATRNESEEVREDLMTTDQPLEDYAASGSIEDELVFGCHDGEYQDAMNAAYAGSISLTGLSLTAAAADASLTRGSGDWGADGVVVGGYYEFGGLSQGTIRARVVTIPSTTKITLSVAVTNEGPTASCTCKGSGYLRMGTTLRSALLEEYYADDNQFWQYLGSVCTGWQWNFTHPGKIRESFSYECSTLVDDASATAGNGTITAYPTNNVMTSISHFRALSEGGAAATFKVREISFNIQAPKGRQSGAGELGASGRRLDGFTVTGQIRVYNSSAARTFAQKHKAGTVSSLEWECVDDAGNVFHYWFGRTRYNGQGGAPKMGGRNSDVDIVMPFIAAMDPTTSTMFQHSKISAS